MADSEQFGAKRSDYIFVTPPKGFFGPGDKENENDTPAPDNTPYPAFGRGYPMPRRFTEGTAKVISWEDIWYLAEWIQELSVVIWRSTTSTGVYSGREVLIENLIGGIEYVDSPYSEIPIKVIKGNRNSLLGVLYFCYSLEEFLSWLNYGIDFVWVQYFLFKNSTYHPITEITKGDFSDGFGKLDFGLYLSGMVNLSFFTMSYSDQWEYIKTKIIDVWTEESPGKKVIEHCFDSDYHPLTAGNPLNHNILLSIYYILESLNNSVKFPIHLSPSYTVSTEVWDASTWRHTTQSPSYDEETGSTTDYQYENQSSGLDENGQIIKTTRWPSATGPYGNLCAVYKSDSRSNSTSQVLWGKEGDTKKYLYYWENVSASVYGRSRLATDMSVSVSIPFDVKYHTANGQPDGEQDYYKILNLWATIVVNISTWHKAINGNIVDIVSPGTYYIIIPIQLDDTKYVGSQLNIGTMSITISSTGREELIEKSLNAIQSGLYDTWVSDVKSIPESMQDNLAETIPLGNDQVTTSPNDGQSYSSSYSIDMGINLDRIYVAALWTPKPAVGLPAIADNFWNSLK